jgi:hypothetical protein
VTCSDRKPPSTIPSSQAPSFKTDVNRNKTRKWVEAKSTSYGGDDWGDYDENDEYGADEERLNEPPSLPRKSSFVSGDEGREFSAPQPAQAQAQPQSQAQGARVVSASSNAPTEASDTTLHPQNRRDFSPTAMPAPLSMSPTSMHPTTAPLKSPESVTSGVKSPAGVYDPRSNIPTGSNKSLPFIRPADIYKRMQEAQEQERRTSMESSNSGSDLRPGSSSMQKVSSENIQEPKHSLADIPERKSEYGSYDKRIQSHPQPVETSQPPPITQRKPPATRQSFDLPKFGNDSTFGDDFWSKSQSGASLAPNHPVTATLSPPNSAEGPIRNMVNKAFNPADSSSLAKQDSLRSQTTSTGTSDISPILSPLYEADIKPATQGSSQPTHVTNPLLTKPDLQSTTLHNIAVTDSGIKPLPNPPKLESAASSRSASPSKGRVKGLATQFEDIDSRRSSVISVSSKKSIAEVKTFESPKPQAAVIVNPQTTATEPSVGNEFKHRPSMPGQFDSYAMDPEAPTPAPHPHPMREYAEKALAAHDQKRPEVISPELQPTTEVRQLDGKDLQTGAMATLAAAGAAMGAAIRSSLGNPGTDSNSEQSHEPNNRRQSGDIYSNRPIQARRFDSEVSEPAQIPPTPPLKDESVPFSKPVTGTLSPNPENRGVSPMIPTASTQSHSDWLSGEIDRALTPLSTAAPDSGSKAGSTVSPISPVFNPMNSTQPAPKKRFSWESSAASVPQSQVDTNQPTTAERPKTPDNPRMSTDGLHVINAMPGELPITATDPNIHQHELDATPKANDHSREELVGATGLGTTAAMAGILASSSKPEQHNRTQSKDAGYGAPLSSPVQHNRTPSKDAGYGAPLSSPVQHIRNPSTDAGAGSGAGTEEHSKELPSFREIQLIKSPSDRIATYNQTRQNWADLDSGLNKWMDHLMTTFPEHQQLKQNPILTFNNVSEYHGTPDTPPKDKRTSAGAATAATGKAIAEGLNRLGGKGKGLLGRMGRGRLRGSEGVGN